MGSDKANVEVGEKPPEQDGGTKVPEPNSPAPARTSALVAGRTVHFVASDNTIRALYVGSSTDDMKVTGQILQSGPHDPIYIQPFTGIENVPNDESTQAPGTWHWSRSGS